MNQVVRKIWLALWHLLPANPILVRVVSGASRRPRHLWLRVGYLGTLLAVVLFSLIAAGSGTQSGALDELAKGASQTFKYASMTQLAMMCFLAPIFTAGAITQERDAQTFNILLSTPLTNAQIVFGSLMSRLFFILVLLVASLPAFLITMIYGGVTTDQVIDSFALAGATAVLTGSLAIFVAMLGVGTRRTIFSFYLLIALYMLAVYLLGQWSPTWVEASPANTQGVRMSWLTPLHPFLALDVALNRVYAPPISRLGAYSGPLAHALAYPAGVYVTWTLAVSFVLTTVSVIFVRRGAKAGESTLVSRLTERFRGKKEAAGRTRKPRNVWANPVAWREAKTRASGGSLLRWTIIIAGVVASIVLFVMHASGGTSSGQVRTWLAAIIMVQFAMGVIIATNTAATAMTKEKESKSMDILLTTRLTSRYILWGKLRGLVSFAAPLLVGPMVVLFVFGAYGLLAGGDDPAIWIEASIEVGALMVIYTACACVLALKISLQAKKNVTAVMYSVGLVILLSGLASLIGFAILREARGVLGVFLAPFTPFTAVQYLVDPADLFDSTRAMAREASNARVAGLIGSAGALGIYAFVVWSFYTSLVRNFDMIVRRQSGT